MREAGKGKLRASSGDYYRGGASFLADGDQEGRMTYDWDGKRTRQLKLIQGLAVGMTLVAVSAASAALLSLGAEFTLSVFG